MTEPATTYEDEVAALMAFADGDDNSSAPAPAAPSTPDAQEWPEEKPTADAVGEQDEEEPDEEDGAELHYGSVDEFVREVIVPIYRRKVSGRGSRRWSAEWWRSAEAVSRLEGLWRSWEHLRQDGATGMSTWWRDHADYHMNALFDPDGPFGASEDENKAGHPLPYSPPPPGLFTDVRQ